MELRDIEPFYGWLHLYSDEMDENSPFHEVEHNLFEYDRHINHIPAHPLWDHIESESLLVKVLFADYQRHYAIIELFGEWNDLYENDYKLLAENCLTYFIDAGINRFILLCENVFHGYYETDDYYEAVQEELGHGWICLLRMRPNVREELDTYQLSSYFFLSEICDELPWRKLKPNQLFDAVHQRIRMTLP